MTSASVQTISQSRQGAIDPCALSATELASAIAQGTVTAREAVEAHIARIERVNGALNAVVVKRYDDARTEANARGQCKQPYVIGQGANGGVMMYLADSSELQELRLKGSTSGRDYIGPAGRTPGAQDREIVSFDGRVMILKYVDSEVDGRYGTGIFVRCAPRAAQASAQPSR